ncbi:MAG: hypothetical protein GY762_07920 [Proteobacteria bacterium]|nr:hypothetical protein [Pseudomonadota bacterium]
MLKRRWLEIAGWCLSISLLAWFVYQSFVGTPFWHQLNFSAFSWLVLVGVTIVYSLTLISSGVVSWQLLKALGDRQASMPKVMAVVLLSQMAKYLPGNVAHHVGRVVLSRQLKLSVPRVLFSMFVETLWVLGVAAALVMFYWLGQGGGLFTELPEQWVLSLMVTIVTLAAVGPYLFHGLFERVSGWYYRKRNIDGQFSVVLPSPWVALFGVFVYLCSYLLLGLVLALLGGYFFGHWQFDLLLLGSAFAVAWVAGFVTPGSPAGLGVREVILLGLLAPIYGAEVAAGITALLRVVTVAGDTVAWLLGGVAWRYAREAI